MPPVWLFDGIHTCLRLSVFYDWSRVFGCVGWRALPDSPPPSFAMDVGGPLLAGVAALPMVLSPLLVVVACVCGCRLAWHSQPQFLIMTVFLSLLVEFCLCTRASPATRPTPLLFWLATSSRQCDASGLSIINSNPDEEAWLSDPAHGAALNPPPGAWWWWMEAARTTNTNIAQWSGDNSCTTSTAGRAIQMNEVPACQRHPPSSFFSHPTPASPPIW